MTSPRTTRRLPVCRLLIAAACGLLALGAVGCSRPGGPFEVTKTGFPVPDAGIVTINIVAPPATCTAVQSSQMIPARASLVAAAGGDGGAQADIELTSQLYNLFKSVCGGCHVDSNLGNFSVSQSTFPTVVNQTVYSYITSNDPAMVMPPSNAGGMPFDQRQPSDAVYQLATQLGLWLEASQQAGHPVQSFTLPMTETTSVGYTVGSSLSAQLTNIGTCVPSTSMVATQTNAMDQLDAKFATATALPPTLDQTDLTTLDSATLAQNGVISYAPTYPLWSDNAQKMRYIRVPHGQSVKFDKATQTFTIPPNTRFYKTFLKEVTDVSGNTTYRKIETRLIVSRPDTNSPDGTAAQQNALFGTYVWNADETQASLLTDPLRDGQPFADRIFEYVVDEKAAAPIISGNPANLQAALDAAGVAQRHYAIPGSERCTQCHEGSPSQSFVLGFTPLQVARRPTGSGGVYEAATGDELTQLQRLIDYGVISGMASPSDVLPLEESEGTRTPRNVYELNAQAYMVGNCAHCHNPRGFPSLRQTALKDVLIFLPGSGPNQGIFQFPLETTSPIRFRGLTQQTLIPYITPSLYDLPTEEAAAKYFCPDGVSGGVCPAGEAASFVLAPWRSLIYRNVDTPYDYFDDHALYPHMPLNTSGYDCRVATIMGDWMVSIPARRKDPAENQAPTSTGGTFPPANADVNIQPYQEALPGDPDYEALVGAAGARLQQYHNGGFRYQFCPPSYTADILDKVVQAEIDANQPVTPDIQQFYSPTDPNLLIMPPLTPISPHYISFDDTDPAGPWFPRRPDWDTALFHPDIPTFIANETTTDGLDPSSQAATDLTNVITNLNLTGAQGITLSDDVRSALTKQYPFGLWDTNTPGCDFSTVPTVGSFTGANEPQWMARTTPPASAPVYMASAGAAIFTSVCFNCHGINADSQGLLADEITDLTGGDARVANFRDGFLGPTTAPGTARQAVFGPDASLLGITTDDLSARYMGFMALGGTQKHLPPDVLAEVSASPVLGEEREHITLDGTPDMLKVGLTLCEHIANADPNQPTDFNLSGLLSQGRIDWSAVSGLIDTNGDAEMWLRLCSLNNRTIVRVVQPPSGGWTATTDLGAINFTSFSLYWGMDENFNDIYGNNPVMDQSGNVQMGITPDNVFPVCAAVTDPSQLQTATALFAAQKTRVLPVCPTNIVQPSNRLIGSDNENTAGRYWAARGAINAALAVFLYLDGVERNPVQRQPLYTQCNLIGAAQ